MAKHTITRRQKDISRLQRERRQQLGDKLKAGKRKKFPARGGSAMRCRGRACPALYRKQK